MTKEKEKQYIEALEECYRQLICCYQDAEIAYALKLIRKALEKDELRS